METPDSTASLGAEARAAAAVSHGVHGGAVMAVRRLPGAVAAAAMGAAVLSGLTGCGGQAAGSAAVDARDSPSARAVSTAADTLVRAGSSRVTTALRMASGGTWLTITGTNGKTTTVGLTESMLQAAGLKAIAVGNVGTPILDALRDPVDYDVFAVELSSFQLHWSDSVSPVASVCLNVAEDHVDWHGSYAA